MPCRPSPSLPLPPLAAVIATACLLVVPAAASASADLLEPDAGTETSANAERVGGAISQRLVLGPAGARDVDWFVARAAAYRSAVVAVEHLGEVDGRPLELRVRGAGAARSTPVGNGARASLRVRADASGALRLRVRCVVAPACDGGGAIPYRVRVLWAPRRPAG